MKRLLLRLLYLLQVHRFFRAAGRKKVTILNYHGFTDRKIHEGIENHQGKHLYHERFRSHLEYLKKHHTVLSLDQAVEAFGSGLGLSQRAVVITMDDGYQSNYKLAFPLLKQYQIPATIFLTTQFIDEKEFFWTDRIEYAINQAPSESFELPLPRETGGGFSLPVHFHDQASRVSSEEKIRMKLKAAPQELRSGIVDQLEEKVGKKLSSERELPAIYRPLEWAEVIEMTQSGLVSIGSHSHSHPILTKCRPETLKEELCLSREIIERRTGLACRHFCYPNGGEGDFNQETKKGLREAGYVSGLTTLPGSNDRKSDLFELRRIGVPQDGDLIDFVMNLYGVTHFLSDCKQWLGGRRS